MKRTGMLLLWMVLCLNLSAQTHRLTANDQRNLKEMAVQMVNRFQSNCRTLADKRTPAQEVTCAGGIIDTAMKDFMEDARIEITSLDGKTTSNREVKKYLHRLFRLRETRYKEIRISWYNVNVAENFTKDPNRANLYVGEVTLVQRFSGVTHEGQVLEDQVRRKTKVYATLQEYRVKNTKKIRWIIKLGDISARTIQ